MLIKFHFLDKIIDLPKNKIILVTGGTGTIGESLSSPILEKYQPKLIRIYSLDEGSRSP